MKTLFGVKIQIVLFWIVLVASFLVFAWVLVMEASGYRMNWNRFRLVPTSLIMLDGQPKQVQITINGKLEKGGFPFRLAKILPGQYEINVSHEGYTSWSKIVRLDGGHGVIFDKIILFFAEPKSIDVSGKYTAANIKKDFENQSNAIQIKNNEIWYQKELLTRFSQNVSGAILAEGRTHIILQTGDQINVMELDSTNVTTLAKLTSDAPTSFVLYSNKLVYLDQDKVLEVQIY